MSSKATGSLEFADGGYRFTRVTLEPEIVVGEGSSREDIEELVDHAHRACLIGRSVEL